MQGTRLACRRRRNAQRHHCAFFLLLRFPPAPATAHLGHHVGVELKRVELLVARRLAPRVGGYPQEVDVGDARNLDRGLEAAAGSGRQGSNAEVAARLPVAAAAAGSKREAMAQRHAHAAKTLIHLLCNLVRPACDAATGCRVAPAPAQHNSSPRREQGWPGQLILDPTPPTAGT